MPIRISKTIAKNIMLTTLGLAHPPKKSATKSDVLKSIKEMGQLQIDTIHVVARSPYLVLWSRLGNYEPKWLDALLEEKKIFEYWAHAACFLPIEDYSLYRRLMLDHKKGWASDYIWMDKNKKTINHVLDYVKKNGETKSGDFKRSDGQKGGWWNWKAEKVALEVLFNKGDLMIARREKFQRVYASLKKILPNWDDSKTQSYEESQIVLAEKALKALGVATAPWIADYFYIPKKEIPQLIVKLLQTKEIHEIEVDGWPGTHYIHKNNIHLIKSVKKSTHTTLLSPFDPLLNNRKRLKTVFNFDYAIECYTPAPKRKYGYYTLPILWKGNLIGRLDPKAHRKDGVFEIKNIVLEDGAKITDELIGDVSRAIQDCATWHQTPIVKVTRSTPNKLKAALQKNLPLTYTTLPGSVEEQSY